MTTHIQLSIKMFGAFRKYCSGVLHIDIAEGATASDVKSTISRALVLNHPEFDKDLINKSALANNHRILKEDDRILDSCDLAILPPVCGG